MKTIIWDSLPDCILDKIYENIYYPKPEFFLNEIEKYGEIREYLYYIRRIDDVDSFLELYYDLLVVYLSIEIDNKVPISVHTNNLSIDALEKFKYYCYYLETIDDAEINYVLFYYIKKLLFVIDSCYFKEIIEPIVYSVKFEEIERIGYITYNG